MQTSCQVELAPEQWRSQPWPLGVIAYLLTGGTSTAKLNQSLSACPGTHITNSDRQGDSALTLGSTACRDEQLANSSYTSSQGKFSTHNNQNWKQKPKSCHPMWVHVCRMLYCKAILLNKLANVWIWLSFHFLCMIYLQFHLFLDRFNPCPGNSFFATFAGKWKVIWPPSHISSSRAHSNKIPMAIPIFSGQTFLWCHFHYRATSTSARNSRWRS